MINSSVGRFGRFAIQAELGRGSMGVVYQAIHPGLGVPVAIKVLSDSFTEDASFRERFQREASTIAALNHPGIVRVYDFDAEERSLYIVMEFVEGRSLRYWLSHSGRFTVPVALDLIQQLLSAVGAAHARGIVHRDLKPDNVLVSREGKTKILDFGISKVVGDDRSLTATGALVGTPAYMSPEQVKGEDVDHRTDVYALGVILYELLHGEPPFTGGMPSVIHAQVFEQPRPSTAIPPAIMGVILQAMAKDPVRRFQTCEAFAGALIEATRPDIRPQTPPPDAPPPQTAHSLRNLIGAIAHGKPRDDVGGCAYSGCNATQGWPCAYVDAKGDACTTWWCKKHVVFMDAVPFCPRHASVIRALAATAGTIREIKHRPTVDDRALPLAAMVAEDCDRDLSELVRRRYGKREGVRLANDKTIRQTWEGRGLVAWERSWSALKDQGYLTRIAIRVSAAEPDTVKVSIGPSLIFAAVPDWISRRREGHPPDPADRARFRQRVVEAVLEQIDSPVPVSTSPPAVVPSTGAGGKVPKVANSLAEAMILRLLTATAKMTAFELAEAMAVPYASIEPALNALTGGSFVDSLGIGGNGAAAVRSLPERMEYAINSRGRTQLEALAGPRYVGPAPVSLDELKAALADARKPAVLDDARIGRALGGLVVPPDVVEAVRAAVNSRGSLFIYGAPGNGKTSLARRVAALLGDPVLVPVAVDAEGEVVRVFDPAVHKLSDSQPADRRWRRVERPLIQVGGEFMLEMLEPTWDEPTRSYAAPLQLKAAGGVLLIDDLGRQRVPPKAILDRLLVPLEQGIDFLNLTAAGRKLEVPFSAQLVLSTNLSPAELLDEAYLRRLAYKVQMPDPTWEAWVTIFERERERIGLKPEPRALEMIHALYGGRPLRGNHPRDLLGRLVDVAKARSMAAELRPDLIEAAWNTLFVTS